MQMFLTFLHIMAAIFLIVVVLLQQGKGADIGSAFGAGASQTVFGSRGAGNFLTKLTTGFVILFMATSVSLTYFISSSSVLSGYDDEEPIQPAAPAGSAEPIPGGAPGTPSDFEAVPAPAGEQKGASPDASGSAAPAPDRAPAPEATPAPAGEPTPAPAADPAAGASAPQGAAPSDASAPSEPAEAASPASEGAAPADPSVPRSRPAR